MIYSALNYLAQDLNQFLMRRFSVQDNKAILGSILNETGTVPEGNQNKMILSLVNLEKETNQQYAISRDSVGQKKLSQNLPYDFNMDLLVSAVFTNYGEGLKFLSETIYFFQAKQIFGHENSPGLDPQIQKLTLEVVKMNSSEMHNIWTALGAKYTPSVLFKVRMLSFQSGNINSIDSLIRGVDPTLTTE